MAIYIATSCKSRTYLFIPIDIGTLDEYNDNPETKPQTAIGQSGSLKGVNIVITVTERALLGRINRKIAPEHQKVSKTRSTSGGYDYLGKYVLIESYSNSVKGTHIDLTEYAKELRVIHPVETVVEAA